MTLPNRRPARDQSFYDDVPAHADIESFTPILLREGIRIERIVSTGQSTPAENPHRQGDDEWVVILAGAAGLRMRAKVSAMFVRATMFCRSEPSSLGDVDGKGQPYHLAGRALSLSLLPISGQ